MINFLSGRMITIELPWPDKDLSPNTNLHWYPKNKAKDKAREDGAWCTHMVMMDMSIPVDSFFVENCEKATLIFHPPDRRRRDQDNAIASMKSYLDGVCDKLGFDDSQFEKINGEWGDIVKGGKVILTLEAIEDG